MTAPRRVRWPSGPTSVVAASVVVTAWLARGHLSRAESPSDLLIHQAYVRWAQRRLDAGHLPFDGWFAFLSGGHPAFHEYQSLPHVIAGAVGWVVGSAWVMQLLGWLLMATWPVTLHVGVTAVSSDRWTGAAAAVMAPLLVSFVGFGFELEAIVRYGLWAQLWGMWMLPLALAWPWRAIRDGRHYGRAVVALGAVIAFHFTTGYVAALCLPLWVLTGPTAWRHRLPRMVGVAAGGAAVASLAVVPLMADGRYLNSGETLQGSELYNSYGGPTVLRRLVAGDVLDFGRWFPVVTVLAAVGLVVALSHVRRSEPARVVLGGFAGAMVLFSGRSTFGWLLRFVPGSSDLLLHRYVSVVQLFGVVLAAVGLRWAAGEAIDRARRVDQLRAPVRVAAGVVAVGLLAGPAYAERLGAMGTLRDLDVAQAAVDRNVVGGLDRLYALAAVGGGRVYGGSAGQGPGGRTRPGLPSGLLNAHGRLRIYQDLLARDVDQVGRVGGTLSLLTDPEFRFDESVRAQFDLWGIRWLVWRTGVPLPDVAARRVASGGGYVLYRVPTTGYVDVVDTTSRVVRADRRTMGRAMAPFLRSADLAAKRYWRVAYDGDAPAAATLGGASVTGPAGRATHQVVHLDDGVVTAHVTARRRAVVLLKMAYHPRMAAFVDGRRVPVQMVAPGMMAVPVDAGEHRVRFEYESYPWYWLLYLVAIAAVAIAVVVPRRLVSRRCPPSAAR